MKKYKILFLSEADPLDKRAWSGTLYYMNAQLSKHFEVTNVGPIPNLSGFWNLMFKIYASINHRLFNKFYDTNHSKLIGKLNLKKVKEKVYGAYDFIYAPAASREVSQIKKIKIPILYASDITFDLIKEKYGFEILFDFSKKEGDEVERLAINRSTLCLYCSDWAASSAINTYGANPDKVYVVPFGANINTLPDYHVEKKAKYKTLEILFLGVDWVRKGGDIVLKTYLLLKAKGIDVHLTICGCLPPIDLSSTDVTIIPFIDKRKPEGVKAFDSLLTKSHLLFVPSQAEAFGIVFCEAAAYGIPVISRDAGGISSIVKNGINGYCLPPDATEYDYFNTITKIVNDRELYAQLSQDSRKKYLEELNWDKWGESVHDIITNYLVKNKSSY
ncbi:glycosyltransferase family 4 protein [Mucilaginibacter arboris]|uniref:Glycosyltransferase n=1 Tax=Mucilaginibacter arboris TaxID=2682090 RepID=A0A7K1SUX0_9SPHI|nr:glycosyltransferase family 4 protein [Mucilaginibacter arboris]MVN21121.1 glycosyltransferase [Mucilaginibacter arboris]